MNNQDSGHIEVAMWLFQPRAWNVSYCFWGTEDIWSVQEEDGRLYSAIPPPPDPPTHLRPHLEVLICKTYKQTDLLSTKLTTDITSGSNYQHGLGTS